MPFIFCQLKLRLLAFELIPRYFVIGKLACDAVHEIFVSIFGNAYGFVKNHNTIGELYGKILMVLSKLECERKIRYHKNVPQVEVRDEVFKVDSYVSAVRAIERIVSEGEGASACNPLDDETELSHYYKFGSILNRRHIKTFVKNNTNQVYEIFNLSNSPCLRCQEISNVKSYIVKN